ncbi:hypothetical protein AU467_25325 [Mesorhizobium loti]|uniref:Uncharacterized protein n=1 Tax=Rhizobium loti TaxID=381 RepID=A0A117N2Y6_RHILI|nr:hypothetical protein AU467_25325 [Mesorhizobium loti]
MTDNTEHRSRSKLARFIAEHAAASGRTFQEVALAAGYSRASNIIRAFATDQAKVPLDRVAALADALRCSTVELFELSLERHFDQETFRRLRPLFFRDVTANERAWLTALKEVSGEGDPILDSDRAARLKTLFD